MKTFCSSKRAAHAVAAYLAGRRGGRGEAGAGGGAGCAGLQRARRRVLPCNTQAHRGTRPATPLQAAAPPPQPCSLGTGGGQAAHGVAPHLLRLPPDLKPHGGALAPHQEGAAGGQHAAAGADVQELRGAGAGGKSSARRRALNGCRQPLAVQRAVLQPRVLCAAAAAASHPTLCPDCSCSASRQVACMCLRGGAAVGLVAQRLCGCGLAAHVPCWMTTSRRAPGQHYSVPPPPPPPQKTAALTARRC